MKQIVFDIEANGLKPTKVWVIVATELDTRETHTFSGDTLLVVQRLHRRSWRV